MQTEYKYAKESNYDYCNNNKSKEKASYNFMMFLQMKIFPDNAQGLYMTFLNMNLIALNIQAHIINFIFI